MSDFLSSLVVSQVQPEAALRPRPASWFEPSGPAEPAAVEAAESTLRPTPMGGRRDRAAAPPRDPARREAPSPHEDLWEKTSPDRSEAVASGLTPASAPFLRAEPLARAVGNPASGPPPPLSKEAREVHHFVLEKDTKAALTEQSPSEPVLVPTFPTPTGSSWTPAPPEPLLVAPAAPLRMSEAPGRDAADATTIQVTIGRIEIRALPPASTVSRKRERPIGIMTLEEYVERRSRT